MLHRNRSALSTAAVILICLSIFCSFLFVVEFSDHDCTHDDSCAVCRIMDMNTETVRMIAAVFAAAVVFMALCAVSAGDGHYTAHRFHAPTLISMRTELRI